MTLKKHIHTEHDESSYTESISAFIYRLELEEFAEDYREYFGRYGFNWGEASHVEKMIKLYGPEYLLK